MPRSFHVRTKLSLVLVGGYRCIVNAEQGSLRAVFDALEAKGYGLAAEVAEVNGLQFVGRAGIQVRPGAHVVGSIAVQYLYGQLVILAVGSTFIGQHA